MTTSIFFGGDDEENMIVAQYLVNVEASGSRQRRAVMLH
jgi:hypothetical protein